MVIFVGKGIFPDNSGRDPRDAARPPGEPIAARLPTRTSTAMAPVAPERVGLLENWLGDTPLPLPDPLLPYMSPLRGAVILFFINY